MNASPEGLLPAGKGQGRETIAWGAAVLSAFLLGCQTHSTGPAAEPNPGSSPASVFEAQATEIAAIPDAQVRSEPEDLVVIFPGDVLFDSGTPNLASEGSSRLHGLAESVRSAADARLAVRCYTDAQGSQSFNLTLSEDRALTVRRYLVGEGIEPGRITAEGFGPQDPVATNDTPAGRRQNRRIEIELRSGAGAKAGGAQSGAADRP